MEEQNGRRAEATSKEDFSTDWSGQEILYLRALLDHAGRNPIDPALQDQQRFSTNPTKTKNPIIEYGETRGWIIIHPKLRVDAYQKLKKKIKQERGDP